MAVIGGRDSECKDDWVKGQVVVGTDTGNIEMLLKSFQTAVEGAEHVESFEAATTLLKSKGPDAADMMSSVKPPRS